MNVRIVEAIVKWINHVADSTLEIEILINLWAEALYFAMCGDWEGDAWWRGKRCGDWEGDAWWRGKSASFHITLFCVYSYLWLGLGTLVPWDFISTHPCNEGVGWRDRFFIGMSVGSSKGTNGWLCFGEEEVILVLDVVGSDVGIGDTMVFRINNWAIHQERTHEAKLGTLERFG